MSTPRVRFAPAPTGYLHVGSARAALFNWLFARRTGGTFVLRVEDTDLERSKPELIDAILDSLRWLGLDWDEGPYFQSERRGLHESAVEQLLKNGSAYLCDCSQVEVRERSGEGVGYDGHCRNREVVDGEGVVVRFHAPDVGTTGWDDLIRGRVDFENDHIEDFVIRRSDGSPTFLVANAVDDADMGITHVIRGEDLVSATPKVLLLRAALGHDDAPVFAHLPLLVNEQRKKLSKRRDDVALGDYRDRGYLPEATVNYLALLGWGPPDGVEIRPVSEIVELFDLAHVNSAPAFFDLKKLEHINAEYVRALAPDEFDARVRPFIEGDEAPWPLERFDEGRWLRMLPFVQDRTRVLSDAGSVVDFLFLDQPVIDEAIWAKHMENGRSVPEILDAVIAQIDLLEWAPEPIGDFVLGLAEEFEGVNRKRAQMPVRVALTGRAAGPPLWESMVELGPDECRRRLETARAALGD